MIADGPPILAPFGIALGGRHKLYVADQGAGILRVNTKNGRARAIANTAPLAGPMGLEMGPYGRAVHDGPARRAR